MEQIAVVEPEFLDGMGIEQHFVRITLNLPPEWKLEIWEEGRYLYYYDEWGMPKDSGTYFDMIERPLANCIIISQLANYPWPKANQACFKGLEFAAKALQQTLYAVIGTGHIGAGILEQCCWMSRTDKFFEIFCCAQSMPGKWPRRPLRLN